MEKKIYFGSNLKMYKNVHDTVKYLTELTTYTEEIRRQHRNLELFILPSYTALDSASNSTDQSVIKLGAQNMCWAEFGKYTGEISPSMLEELGISLVMVGHSERRHIYGETDLEENKKVKTALQHGFTALLCVGETKEEKECGIAEDILRIQIKAGLHGVMPGEVSNVWIAYEPVWSIGEKGTPATPEYARKMHEIMKETLENLYPGLGADIPIFYGGSVDESNAAELICQPSVDGLFVGRAAWDAKHFANLIETAVNRLLN